MSIINQILTLMDEMMRQLECSPLFIQSLVFSYRQEFSPFHVSDVP